MSDLIRREDVMALWDKYHYDIATRAVEFDKDLRKIPSAEPKTGKWEFVHLFPDDTDDSPTGYMGSLVCSNCGRHVPNQTGYHYCPNCGARMDE